MEFEGRIKTWSKINKYRFVGMLGNDILLERLSDDYPFQIKKELMEQIMNDEGI